MIGHQATMKVLALLPCCSPGSAAAHVSWWLLLLLLLPLPTTKLLLSLQAPQQLLH
jgi:hypothetical protein